jgi:hypothetical protein
VRLSVVDLGEVVIEAANGLPHVVDSDGDKPPGDRPPGDLRPYELELMLVKLLVVMVMAVYDPLRPAEEILETEPWGMTVRRGVGEPLEAPFSRRRSMSLAKDGGGSSPAGEEARRFCPAMWYSARSSSCMPRNREVSSIANSTSSLLTACP